MLFEAPMRDMQIYIGLQALYQLALSIARRCAALPPAAFCGDWTLKLRFEAAVQLHQPASVPIITSIDYHGWDGKLRHTPNDDNLLSQLI